MRFTAACTLLLAASADAFHPQAFAARSKTALRQSTEASTEASTEEKAPTKKAERLRMMKSDRFYRQGFKEARKGVEEVMEGQFKGEIVNELKNSNYLMERDGVKVFLAKVRTVAPCRDPRT
jgi:4-hydroxy-3-methylbut-2-enyl diphosphate reductase